MGEGKRVQKYIDLDLWVHRNPEGEGYRVQATAVGRMEWTDFEEPFSHEELTALRNAISCLPARDIRPHVRRYLPARELGRRLYEKVFFGPVRDLLKDLLDENQGVRLRLHIRPEVAEWPWELLCSTEGFLALSVRTPIVRHLKHGRPLPALRAAFPLRMLVVVASPEGTETLDAELELQKIRDALGWLMRLGIVKVERLETPTLAALEERLENGTYHVLHFIGHGTFDRERSQGALLFEDGAGGRALVNGERLALTLSDHRSMRLVVLNACESARGTADDLFAGVAQGLVRKRIPAVVAMQHSIADNLALAFSARFYRALVRGRAVEWAMAKARKAMQAAGEELDWAIPVLFLSARDGHLFRWRPSWGLMTALGMVVAMLTGFGLWYRDVSIVEPQSSVPPVVSCPSSSAVPGMGFVLVRGGTFQMGVDSGEDDEKPMHEVTVTQPFCLGVHEVTQKQWTDIMGANSNHSDEVGDDLPVTFVSYDEAQEFIRKLNEREGRTIFRLPREAEWELAVQDEGGWNCDTNRLAPARSFHPNRLGLYDMLGNVWEWVEDWYGPYGAGLVIDPKGPPGGTARVRRGGSYDRAVSHCRATRRGKLAPNSEYKNSGLRVLREIR